MLFISARRASGSARLLTVPRPLNPHVHFHVCVVDGVFEALPKGLILQPAEIDAQAIAQVQANVRRRILRAYVALGHLEACDAKDMAAYAHGGGFSVHAGVCIEAPDRAGLERLLRYCARPPLAMERLKQRGAALVHRGDCDGAIDASGGGGGNARREQF